MNNKELLGELEDKFVQMKKNLNLKANLEELDKIFFIRDSILHEGFVSNNLGRQICSRIADDFMGWNNYLHGLIFPNPGSMINMAESRIFDDNEKKKINKLISKAMGFVSLNTLIGLGGSKMKESKFIDDAIDFWNSEYKKEIEKIIEKVSGNWLKEN